VRIWHGQLCNARIDEDGAQNQAADLDDEAAIVEWHGLEHGFERKITDSSEQITGNLNVPKLCVSSELFCASCSLLPVRC
jgi:hypothetical protein